MDVVASTGPSLDDMLLVYGGIIAIAATCLAGTAWTLIRIQRRIRTRRTMYFAPIVLLGWFAVFVTAVWGFFSLIGAT